MNSKILILIFLSSILLSCGQKEEEFSYTLDGQKFKIVGYREMDATYEFLSVTGSLVLSLSLNNQDLTQSDVVLEEENITYTFNNYRDIGLDGLCNGEFKALVYEDEQQETATEESGAFDDYTPEGYEDNSNASEEENDVTLVNSYYRAEVDTTIYYADSLGSECTFAIYEESYIHLQFKEDGTLALRDSQRQLEYKLEAVK